MLLSKKYLHLWRALLNRYNWWIFASMILCAMTVPLVFLAKWGRSGLQGAWKHWDEPIKMERSITILLGDVQQLYTAALMQLLLLRTLQVQNMKHLHKDAPLLTLVAPENSAASVITRYKVWYNWIHFSCVNCASKPGFEKTSERGINTPRCF